MNFHNRDDKRSEQRIRLNLSITVSGENENSEVWREETETLNVSTRGVRFHLQHKISPNEELLMRASLPSGATPLFLVKVTNVFEEDTDSYKVGVEVLDGTEEWERLFVLWASDVRDY